jgi:DNA-binding transcriptional LysR family regulator
MDRVTQMTVFAAVAEEEGFAAAARRLKISPPVVTRAVAELEERLGVKLLTRTTRYVKVTDAGFRFLEDTNRILEEIQVAEDSAVGINSTPRGELTITAPVMFGRLFVLPALLDYISAYPDIHINCVFVDRVVNLLEEGIDAGIRIGELPDSSMRALRVGKVNQVICGSPTYLKANGIPRTPDDLVKHTLVRSSAVSPTHTWHFSEGITIKIKPRLVINSNDSVVSALKAGLGLGRLISYQVAPELADGSLKKVLSKYEPPQMPVHIIHREGRSGSAKIRSFVDVIAESLRSNKAIN